MKLWPVKVFQCVCADGFLVTSIFNIFRWLFPTKTTNISFYSLSHAISDSVINFIKVRYQDFTVFCHYREIHRQRTVKLLSKVLIRFGETK